MDLSRAVAPSAVRLIGHRIATIGYDAALAALIARARAGSGGAAFFCNAHMAVEGLHLRRLRAAMARADWVFPDGMPIVMALRLLGLRRCERVAGMDVMPDLCRRAADERLPVFFYGATPPTLAALARELTRIAPGLEVAGMISPPFRDAWEPADADLRAIAGSGARLCFVGLGCPKQELWIDQARPRLGAVLLGVGAAFATTARTMPMAPQWMRDAGLEWIYRMGCEPGRLARRYLRTNPVFFERILRELWTR